MQRDNRFFICNGSSTVGSALKLPLNIYANLAFKFLSNNNNKLDYYFGWLPKEIEGWGGGDRKVET